MKKGDFDIYLLYIQVVKCGNSKESLKNHRFNNSCKGLIKIYFRLLEITFDYPSGLKLSDLIINISFNPINPFF